MPLTIARRTCFMPDKPKCIIVTGRPGAGKSTLSKELAKLLYLPVISRDEIKEGYVNTFGVRHDALPPDSNGIATEIFFETVSFLLARKISLIVEAAFQHHVWQTRIDNLAASARVCFVICSVESDVAAHRHLHRGLNDPKREFYHGDKRVAVYRQSGILESPGDYETPAFDLPTIEVSTLDGYSPALNTVRDFLASSTA
jgi:energy-coupling factor transporter ATP-binding protein EcfA2